MTAPASTHPALPEGRAATSPPERRGVARDGVRLLVAGPNGLDHDVFRHLPLHLAAGDVVVVNTSATRAAAIEAWGPRGTGTVHFSARWEVGDWVVEIRRRDGQGPLAALGPGDGFRLAGAGHIILCEPVATGETNRLWRARVWTPVPLEQHLSVHGRPISYGYAHTSWPLSDYQTIFSRPDDPTGSSAEMPSAARPFTHTMVTDLVRRGVVVVPLTLHAGVSSLERHESPPPEWFSVPPATAEAVNAARDRGGRVVAVGTTVTRALESVADREGGVEHGEGWTDLVLGPGRPVRVVAGLVTGWHPPDASHLLLLEAVAGSELLGRSYHAAVDHGYLWHEFGDSCLLLP